VLSLGKLIKPRVRRKSGGRQCVQSVVHVGLKKHPQLTAVMTCTRVQDMQDTSILMSYLYLYMLPVLLAVLVLCVHLPSQSCTSCAALRRTVEQINYSWGCPETRNQIRRDCCCVCRRRKHQRQRQLLTFHNSTSTLNTHLQTTLSRTDILACCSLEVACCGE
jgi:hypothetical protein